MDYDSAHSRVVLFGGAYGSVLGDTWEWDGMSWTQRAITGPPPRSFHAMTYDSVRRKLVLFGGEYTDSDYHFFGDTWEWDGAAWTPRTLAGPMPREAHAVAYDSIRRRIVLFGGFNARAEGQYLGDTWEWDGASWMQVATTGPTPRVGHRIAYDSTRGRVTLFGGIYYSAGYHYLGDTWEWDGANWTRLATTGPTPREGHALGYDSRRARVVLFGGYSDTNLGDTWEWDGESWTQRSSAGPMPREEHSVAYDSARARLVLFGGYNYSAGYQLLGDTWEWDGASWTQRSTTGPTPGSGHALAYDSARLRAVLFGGNGGDTWEWDGTSWTQRFTPGPPQRTEFGMAYDSARGRVVLFGGYSSESGGSELGDTWEYGLLHESPVESAVEARPHADGN